MIAHAKQQRQGQETQVIKQFFAESIQTTAIKKSKGPTLMTTLSHPFQPEDLEAFANLSTPKRNQGHQSDKPKKGINKSYTIQWSLINVLVVCSFILMIIVFSCDFSTKKTQLLSRIKFQIKHCNSSYFSNRCHTNESHLKVKQMFQKCFQWNECKAWNAQEELANRVSLSGMIGEIIKDFFAGLGMLYVAVLILLILSIGYLAKGKQRILIEIKSH